MALPAKLRWYNLTAFLTKRSMGGSVLSVHGQLITLQERQQDTGILQFAEQVLQPSTIQGA